MTSVMTHSIVILGAGYAGKYLADSLITSSRRFFATSRDPERNLSHVPFDRRVKFDLEQPSTWPNIPIGSDLIWCFPPTPFEQVRAFARNLAGLSPRLVVLGSTSAYDTRSQSNE